MSSRAEPIIDVRLNEHQAISRAVLDAFKKDLVDRLEKIGIDAIRPQIRQAAEAVAQELQASINSHTQHNATFSGYDVKHIIKLIHEETVVHKVAK